MQPPQLDDGLFLHRVFGPGTRQQFAEVEVAAVVLHQQQQTGRRRACFLAGRFDPDIGADQRLDTLGTRFPVKLDRAEKIAQVGDGEGGLLVGSGGGNDFIDAVGAVDD